MIRRKMKFGLAEAFRVGGVCGIFYGAAEVLTTILKASALAKLTLAAVFPAPVVIGLAVGIACMFIASALKTRSEAMEKEEEREKKHMLAQELGVAPQVGVQPQVQVAQDVAATKNFTQSYLDEKSAPASVRQV